MTSKTTKIKVVYIKRRTAYIVYAIKTTMTTKKSIENEENKLQTIFEQITSNRFGRYRPIAVYRQLYEWFSM